MIVKEDLCSLEEFAEAIRKNPVLIKIAFETGKLPLPNDFILLNTNAFDDLDPEAQEFLKRGLGIFLKRFGRVLIGACCIFLMTKNKEPLEIIEEGLSTIEQKLDQIAEEIKKKHFSNDLN